MFIIRLILSVFFINLIFAAKLPPNLTKCSQKDQECLKLAIMDALPKFSKGVRALGVQGIDPLNIPEMKIPGGSGSVKITQTLTDGQLYGLSNLIIDKMNMDIAGQKMSWKFHCPNLTLIAHYVIDGQLMIFPVNGNGQMVVHLDNVMGDESIEFIKVKKGNDEHVKISKTALELDANKVDFHFENLFDGNKQLGDQINQVLNDNWRTVFDELKNSYNEGFKQFLDNIANRFFDQVPISEIFSD